MIKDRSVFSTQKDIIKTARRNKNLLNSIVAEDENWCFRHDPTTKPQRAEWKSPASPKGIKVRFQKPKVKKILVCFYDSKGIIRHEFVPEGQTVTGNFYLSVLERIWKRFRRARPEYSVPDSWFLLHDNAPVHLFTTMHRHSGQLLYKNFLPEKSVRAPSSAILP